MLRGQVDMNGTAKVSLAAYHYYTFGNILEIHCVTSVNSCMLAE